MFIIGINSAKFNSVTVGSAGKSFGKSLSDFAASTLSFTFRKASVGVTLKSKVIFMDENPSIEVEVISSTPDIPLISFSSGRVINFSISIAEFPG